MELRKQFEKLHPVPDYLRYVQSANDYRLHVITQDGNDKAEKYNALWQGFQSGHAAGLEQQAKRIAELEASLADSNEALQVMGLKLEQAEADIARLRVDAGRLDWLEDNSYALPYKDHGAGPELDLSRPAIDALMKDQSHSANTVGGPTPVMDASPACERKE